LNLFADISHLTRPGSAAGPCRHLVPRPAVPRLALLPRTPRFSSPSRTNPSRFGTGTGRCSGLLRSRSQFPRINLRGCCCGVGVS